MNATWRACSSLLLLGACLGCLTGMTGEQVAAHEDRMCPGPDQRAVGILQELGPDCFRYIFQGCVYTGGIGTPPFLEPPVPE